MLRVERTLHSIVITQPHGESEKVEDCVEKLIRRYPGTTRVNITGLLARKHHLTFRETPDAIAAVEWIQQNY